MCGEDANGNPAPMGFRTSSTQDFHIACMNCTVADDTEGLGTYTLDTTVYFQKVAEEEGGEA
jgi:hypothetical protein